jgi:hypothetical protein
MKILDAQVRTIVERDQYHIRIEATNRAAAFLFALGIEPCYIGPEENSGRAWWRFPYSRDVDDAMIELVEFVATLRERQPSFGQIALKGFER